MPTPSVAISTYSVAMSTYSVAVLTYLVAIFTNQMACNVNLCNVSNVILSAGNITFADARRDMSNATQ